MEAILDKATKKKLGSFYSPAVLANYLASKANEYFHRDKESLSFLDPAVGDGELLKAMFKMRQDTTETYIGVDIDENALDNTRIRLGEAGVDCFLFNDDALNPKTIPSINGWDYIKFRSNIEEIDCIISNPPWGADISLSLIHI